jgi:hypothetical protein
MDDADDVLSALRLGWSVAEMRGRNRPDGPPGEVIGMPDHLDHPLPLRIERGKTELRIEIQSVVAELARRLCVDEAPDGTSYSAELGEKTKLLAHARAPKAADALRQALDLLGHQQPEQALQALADGLAEPWADLAELIWQFDAHVQDRLAALSESQAIGYQLGRGLADTYWALNPGQEHGSASWSFLLGERRCDELQRLTGRIAAYMGEYTAAAIAGSLEVWQTVVATPGWMGDPARTSQALYSQIRRWYELIVLGQDPTTLIGPAAVMRNYRTLARVFQLFWPELVATVFGLGALITLLFLLHVDGATAWEKTLSGVLAAVGLSLAGMTGTLKNSAQALTKRLRQDAYTDLVALAVQTAPAPPDHSALQKAISHRALTPATPN